MKYLKTYEEKISSIYEINDYVLLTELNFKNKRGWVNLPENSYGKILKIEVVNVDKNDISYFVSVEDDYVWISESNIIRKLTPEEIEQYKLEKETDKYNL